MSGSMVKIVQFEGHSGPFDQVSGILADRGGIPEENVRIAVGA